jgi:putative ABC transport system permease protein
MIADLKFALRMLVKAPGFTAIAILTLALGIGANSAIFSVIDAVLLRPLPFPKPSELVAVWNKVAGSNERQTVSYPDYADFREQAQTLESLTAFTAAGSILGNGAESHELHGLAITSDVFRVLGVQPFLGRAYTRAEDASDSAIVVLSYDVWQRYFNGDRNIIGRQILLSLRPYTVLGVMPRGFRYPFSRLGVMPSGFRDPLNSQFDYMMPLHPLVASEIDNRGSHFLRMIGRLKPETTVRQASAEIAGMAAQLETQYRDSNTGRSAFALSLHDDLVGDVRPALFTVLSAVFVVLLIACANVANLLLARAMARSREIAIRTALGASRIRIIRQLLAEGLLLAIAGGFAGLLFAWWGIDLLRLFGPQDVLRIDQVQINSLVVVFTLAAAVFSILLFALVPALQVSRQNVTESLQEGDRGTIGSESHRLRALLVISQVALSMLLLASAGLLIKSFANLRSTNPGFDPSRVVTTGVVLPRAKYSEAPRQQQFFDQLRQKLRGLPGVETVGGAFPLAFSGNDSSSSFWIDGRPDPGHGNHPDASNLTIIGDYFRAMRIPLLAGRTFEERDKDGAPPVVIVNEAFARKFFPNENPIGQRVMIDKRQNKRDVRQIVGVVGSTRHQSLAIAPVPEFYIPAAQDPSRRIDIVLRTSLQTLSGLETAVRNAVHGIDEDVYVPKLDPLRNLIGTTLTQPRFNMVLLGCFAGVALVLAAIGIYGVIAYSVAQRTKEIGIRMALGAQRSDMLQMIFRQSLSIVALGLLIGITGALVATRLMATLLYGVGTNDFVTYVTVILVLIGAALLASYFPARRAMRVDPIVALRYE